MDQNKTSGTLRKFIIAVVIILIIALGFTGLNYYLKYFRPNVTGNREYLYIHTGATFNAVFDTIKKDGIVKDTGTFSWAAQNMNYINRVKPGQLPPARRHEQPQINKYAGFGRPGTGYAIFS